MKRKIDIISFLLFIIPLCILSLFVFCVVRNREDTNKENTEKIEKENMQFTLPKSLCSTDNLDEYINNLTYEQKLSQLFIYGFSYNYLNKNNLEGNKYEDGGYILIDSMSCLNKEDLIVNLNKLKNLSSQDSNDIPIFLGIDSEGGIVQRFYWYKFKKLGDIKNSIDICADIKTDIDFFHSTGFNLSLAPVIDTPYSAKDWIYPRTIDTNIDTIGDIASKYIKCVQNQSISTTAKHFPGHGDTNANSHYVVPTINHTKEQWESKEKIPFQVAIQNDVDFIMVGHMVYPQINDDITSLSQYWNTTVLRDEMGFEGIIITDDLNMLHPNTEEECINLVTKSLNSGVDIVLVTNGSVCGYDTIHKYIYGSNKLQVNDINTKVKRILQVKKERFCN